MAMMENLQAAAIQQAHVYLNRDPGVMLKSPGREVK